MYKKYLIILFILINFTLFIPDISYANYPSNYNEQDEFLSAYFLQIENTEDKVEIALNIIKAMYPNWEDEYKYNIFDCSEMTEYVKYFFNKCGIESIYCQSDYLYHCWLEVPNEDNDNILIECTKLSIINDYKEDYYIRNDIRYDRKMRHNQIDWWNAPMFKIDYNKLPK